MVIITIFIEGGNLNDVTSGTETLRESFRKLLTPESSTQQFRLIVEMRGPNNQTTKDFKNQVVENPDLLILLDLDDMPTEKQNKLTAWGLNEQESQVFLMIQAMESWILSQPDCIEKFVTENYVNPQRRKPEKILSEDDILKDKVIQEIAKPDDKLNTILQRYFFVEKRNKKKKIKYDSKIIDGAEMLGLLEIESLKATFPEVKRLTETLTNFINQPPTTHA